MMARPHRQRMPQQCRKCGRPIGWIRGVHRPLQPGHVLLNIDGAAAWHGFDLQGYSVRGELVAEGEPVNGRVFKAWLPHACDPVDIARHEGRYQPHHTDHAARAAGEGE